MSGKTGIAAEVPGAPQRTLHDHAMPGVDTALTPFPEAEAQRAGIERDLRNVLSGKLCVVADRGGVFGAEVTLDNVAAGHGFPSGATQDRRAWVEVVAHTGTDVIYQSGVVADDRAVLPDASDPDLWLMRDVMLDDDGRETHDFWKAKSYTSQQLPPAVTNDPTDPRFFHSVTKRFQFPVNARPDRVTLRVRLRAVGLDVLDDLIATGDLDPAMRTRVPVFDLGGTMVEWRAADHQICATP